MNFLRGYQNFSHGQQDIGLFTFYREQAQRQNQALQFKPNKNKIKRKYQNNSIQYCEKKKTKKKLSVVLKNSKLAQDFLSEQSDLMKRKQSQKKIIFNRVHKKKVQQFIQKKTNIQLQAQIFTSRKQMIMNKKFKRNQFQTPQIEKKIFLSPRSQIFTFSYQTKDVKTNSSQQLTKNTTIDPPQLRQALPNVKYKGSVQNPQKIIRSLIQDEAILKNNRQVDPLIPKIRLKQKKVNNIKNDEDFNSAFVMISNRQHRLLTERKQVQVPLIKALRHYSRNF